MVVTAAPPGGQLEKAMIIVHSDDKSKGDPEKVEFQFNPAEVTIQKSAPKAKQPAKGSDTYKIEEKASEPWKITLQNVIFDTYETRENVKQKYIDSFERFAGYYSDTHKAPKLLFVWGKFLTQSDDKNNFDCKLEQFQCTYTMFLNDGTPVRAKCGITLVEDMSHKAARVKKEKKSPDNAKFRTFKRGDTLQSIAFEEYDNPAEWRRIADVNGIDDPLNVEPGTRLLVPPILK